AGASTSRAACRRPHASTGLRCGIRAARTRHTDRGARLTVANRTPLAIDETITLTINGSCQRIRLCAARPGLPPLLVVQGGPALPMLHEVRKFQRLLNLETDFLVGYWEQRGCGNASARDAHSASLAQQVEDLRGVLQWWH